MVTDKRLAMIEMYSDYYKDTYGCRPHCVDYRNFTLEELESDFATFKRVCEENEIAEAAYELTCQLQFEEQIAKTIKAGAGDRITAIRWLYQAFAGYADTDADCYMMQNLQYFLYNTGIGHKECGKIYNELKAALETA